MNRLFEYAFFPNFDESIHILATMADDEKWCFSNDRDQYSVLKNYLEHTFRRLEHEGKVLSSADGSHFVFNTGLFTRNLEEIYAFFTLNRNPPPHNPNQKFFRAFKQQSDISLAELFSSLPSRADYFNDPEQLIFNPNKELRINIDHIIEDNINRFPKKYVDDINVLKMILTGAVEKSRKLATLDYKIAIPQCYNNQIQLLFPLFITNDAAPDLALALSHINTSYRASTVLTLRMAYNNARLIVKPQSQWLSPQFVR